MIIVLPVFKHHHDAQTILTNTGNNITLLYANHNKGLDFLKILNIIKIYEWANQALSNDFVDKKEVGIGQTIN